MAAKVDIKLELVVDEPEPEVVDEPELESKVVAELLSLQ